MATHLDLEEQEQLDQLKHFWNTWGTLISSVLVVVLGSLAAWNGYQYWQNRQSVQAAAMFDAVDQAVKAGDQERLKLAFDDLKSRYGGTTQASQAGLLAAKAMMDAGQTSSARDALQWVAGQAGDAGYQALAKLRLSAVLVGLNDLDGALAALNGAFPVEFDGMVADRKGDILRLQGKSAEASAEYLRAYKVLDESLDYRRVVEVKLNALGVNPSSEMAAQSKALEGKK